MRASVHMLVAVICTAACHDNPGFGLWTDPDDPATTTGATTGATGTGTDDTGPRVCAPVVVDPVEDVCAEWLSIPLEPPNLADTLFFADAPCGSVTEIHVKREADALIPCDATCAVCDDERAVGIGEASKFAIYRPLLPEDGSCTRLWHRSEALDNGTPCNSVAYAAFDEQDALRFATSYIDANPFTATPKFEISITPTAPSPCPVTASTLTSCKPADNLPIPVHLEFLFGDCHIPDAVQNTVWTDIFVGEHEFVFENRSGYRCLKSGVESYSWFLHREF